MGLKKRKFYASPKAIVESGKIGRDTRIWAFSHIAKKVQVGKDCNIGEHCYLESGVLLGDAVTVKNGVCLWQGVVLEDNVFIGPNAVFTNELYPRSKRYGKYLVTRVKKGAAIGANATVICGIVIGKYAMIGAGSVVTKNVGDYVLVYGNPAVFKGYACECGDKLKIVRNKARCHCGRKYIRQKNSIKKISSLR